MFKLSVLLGSAILGWGSHHYVPANWAPGSETCIVTEQVSPAGSTGGAPTPLSSLSTSCVWTPAHWKWQHPVRVVVP